MRRIRARRPKASRSLVHQSGRRLYRSGNTRWPPVRGAVKSHPGLRKSAKFAGRLVGRVRATGRWKIVPASPNPKYGQWRLYDRFKGRAVSSRAKKSPETRRRDLPTVSVAGAALSAAIKASAIGFTFKGLRGRIRPGRAPATSYRTRRYVPFAIRTRGRRSVRRSPKFSAPMRG